MNELVQELYDFFTGQVPSTIGDLRGAGFVDIPKQSKCFLATYGSTEFRFKDKWIKESTAEESGNKTHNSVGQFLENRRVESRNSSSNAPNAGGVWLKKRALFDFAISVREDEEGITKIDRCDCGFYALIDDLDRFGTDSLPVALRYEADFVNTGMLWADHPTHHLQWDRLDPDKPLGATEIRTRTQPMLPIHFLEFCTRHFLPNVWEKLFKPYSENIADLSLKVKDETEEFERNDRLEVVNSYRQRIQNFTENLASDCEPQCDYEWGCDEAVGLPL
jgi:hypothetical protein